MDEKNKAGELVGKFKDILNNTLDVSYPYSSIENIDEAAKQCALICCDEIWNAIPFDQKELSRYWKNVCKEIESL